MARQTGIIRLKGTIGGVTFYKTADGHLAREKGGVDKNRIANDPAFQRTRENGAEFGRAGAGGKLVRKAIRLLLQNAKDKRVTSRLTQSLMRVIKTDPTNERGLRTIPDGDMALINGFEFNINGKLSTVMFADYTPTLDRVAGTLDVEIPAFTPNASIDAPGGTTHFKIVSGLAEVDFENEEFVFDSQETAILPWDAQATALINLVSTVTANSTLPLLQVLGVSFYQEVNGDMYPLKNGAYNSLSLIGVDQV
ncbi:MAG: hypothetical protein CVU03_02080 [Bacteroidetes bacterium HGW-Bacteroidetes-2]|jgi:hypothetical protein|nr:MAG: hypothetical protein CVU13_06240 [Bacteroidetes bacterium HGW-Bacteroidetes-8]PKP26685.1 MAG: hypothetical protein CVU03_02080 [Bacteroidetes bacterium HGW-Bacteroidetes-2]